MRRRAAILNGSPDLPTVAESLRRSTLHSLAITDLVARGSKSMDLLESAVSRQHTRTAELSSCPRCTQRRSKFEPRH